MQKYWQLNEQVVALKAPVREAEFYIDDESPMRLYDCMIPMIKECRRFTVTAQSKFSIDDFKAKQKVLQLEWDL